MKPIRLHFVIGLVLVSLFIPCGRLQAAWGARVVHYSQTDIIPIRAKIRFSTLIVLPANEEILDFTTGDKDFWIINGVHNLCYVHPAQANIKSNLNLITASGHVYSFLLTEISDQPNEQPDLKVFVVPKDESSIASVGGQVKYVRASEVEAYKQEADAAQAQAAEAIRQAQSQIQQKITAYREQYPARLRFDYEYKSKATRPPFSVTAIYHDDRFTYIKSNAQEKPAIYEVKDGKPDLVNFDLENGVYIIPEIVDKGYLIIGKQKVSFKRRTQNGGNP
ncbi:MAG TPA: TrbG/VirB9 family P-type conjugative transfer protein [Terriglobia bacterium]|nr:TrbG/VirB9 family P-type conjugative transfer protein [Terriglobia bacterium]